MPGSPFRAQLEARRKAQIAVQNKTPVGLLREALQVVNETGETLVRLTSHLSGLDINQIRGYLRTQPLEGPEGTAITALVLDILDLLDVPDENV